MYANVIAAAVVIALAGGAEVAAANTYCVHSGGTCAGGTIDEGADLQKGLDDAAANAGLDQVQIGPGTFTSTSGSFSYTGGAANPVAISGAGVGQTTIGTNGQPFLLSVAGGDDTTVTDLTLAFDPNLANEVGLKLVSGGTAQRILVTGTATGMQQRTGVWLAGGNAKLRDSSLQLGTTGTTGVLSDCSCTVQDTTIRAGTGVSSLTLVGIGDTTVHRVDVFAGKYGLFANGGQIRADNSLIRLAAGSSYGVDSQGTGAGADTKITADGLTIVGANNALSTGAIATESTGGVSLVKLDDTIIRNFETSLRRVASSGGLQTDIQIDYSDYEKAKTLDDGPGVHGAISDGGHTIDADPQFVNPQFGGTDPTAGDFHLAAGSPARDSGDPAGADPLGVGATTDLDQSARVQNGRRDMGSYELSTPVVTQRTLTITKTGAGTGRVTSSPGGIDCGATCAHDFPDSTSVTLSASPDAGSTFGGWSGDCSPSGLTCTTTLDAAKSVTVAFAPAGGGGPPKPVCTLTANGSRVFARAIATTAKKKQKPRKGVLKLTARCDQATQATLTGKVTAKSKKKKGKKSPQPKTYKFAPLVRSTQPGKALVLTVKLPKAALAALKKGAQESASFSLTATDANGSSTATVTIPRLKLVTTKKR